jgi:hypothetical protein
MKPGFARRGFERQFDKWALKSLNIFGHCSLQPAGILESEFAEIWRH